MSNRTMLARSSNAHALLGEALRAMADSTNREAAAKLGFSVENVRRAWDSMTIERFGEWLPVLAPGAAVKVSVHGGFITVELPFEARELVGQEPEATYKVHSYRDEEDCVFTVIWTDRHGEERDLFYGDPIRSVGDLIDEIISQSEEAYDVAQALSLIEEAQAMVPSPDTLKLVGSWLNDHGQVEGEVWFHGLVGKATYDPESREIFWEPRAEAELPADCFLRPLMADAHDNLSL